jgi:hypothetical protein
MARVNSPRAGALSADVHAPKTWLIATCALRRQDVDMNGTGAGIQIRAEGLAVHLTGHEPGSDSKSRWDELEPLYRAMADQVSP